MTWRAAFWTAATVAVLALGGIAYFLYGQHRIATAMAGWLG